MLPTKQKILWRESEREAYRICSGEEVHVPADGPDRGVVFHDEGDGDGLKGAHAADHCGERELVVGVGFQCCFLQDEKGSPCQRGDY